MGFDNRRKVIRFLLVLIVILSIFAGYLVITNNPRFKIKMAIQTIFHKAEDSLRLTQKLPFIKNFLQDKVVYNNRIVGNASLNGNVLDKYIDIPAYNLQKLINNSTIKTTVNSDLPNKYINYNLEYSYNNERILAEAYIDNNQLYIYLKDYLDKIIKIDSEYFNAEEFFIQTTSSLTVDEIVYIMNIIKSSTVDASEFATVTDTKEEITINQEKVNVHKTTLNIDTEFVKKFKTIIFNKILNDERAKEILVKLSEYETVVELENVIKEELIKSQNENEEYTIYGEYSLYTLGVFNKVVRNELRYFNDKNIVVQYTTYKTIKFNKQISIYENKELTTQINIIEEPNNVYDIAIVKGKDMSLDLTGVISDELVNLNYTLRISKLDDIKGDIRYEIKNKNSSGMDQSLVFRLNTPESYGTIQITVDSTLKIVNEMEKLDFGNSTKLSSLKSEELQTILTNFTTKNPEIIKTFSDIISLGLMTLM